MANLTTNADVAGETVKNLESIEESVCTWQTRSLFARHTYLRLFSLQKGPINIPTITTNEVSVQTKSEFVEFGRTYKITNKQTKGAVDLSVSTQKVFCRKDHGGDNQRVGRYFPFS